VTLTACLRGVLPLESNHACNFPTLSSCVVTAVGTVRATIVHGCFNSGQKCAAIRRMLAYQAERCPATFTTEIEIHRPKWSTCGC
jgi:hypothetical protein